MKTLKCMLLIILVAISSQAVAASQKCQWLKKRADMKYENHIYYLDQHKEAFSAVPKDQDQIDTYFFLQESTLDEAAKYSTIYLALCKD